TAEEHARWTRYESVFNRGLGAYPTWVVCGYDARALPEQVVADALRTHPLVSTGGAPDASSGYAEDGELVQRPVLRKAERAADRVELDPAAGAQTVRLTLAGAADARERILHAASELFYRNGIRGSGINTIIAHSGVAKATLFHHFPAKDDLVVAWLRQPAS